MANTSFITGKNIRIYKDGVFLGTVTSANSNTTQEVSTRQYLGDDEEVTVTGSKTYEGDLTRDMSDESFLETIIGRRTSSTFTVYNYEDDPDELKATVNSGADFDISFTTPDQDGLIVNEVALNLKKVGSFEGGLDVEIWEGLAGSGTLKGTLTLAAGQLPSLENKYVTFYLDEANEFAVTKNVAHTMRITPAGVPTGDVELYGLTTESYSIAVADEGTETFEIVGDFTDRFVAGEEFEVTGSTGNDGSYTVASSTFSGGNTVITVNENIIDPTDDGTIELYGTEPYYAISYEMSTLENADYTLDIALLRNDGTEIAVIRDTGVEFLSNGITINPDEPISEATSWRAKKRTIID